MWLPGFSAWIADTIGLGMLLSLIYAKGDRKRSPFLYLWSCAILKRSRDVTTFISEGKIPRPGDIP